MHNQKLYHPGRHAVGKGMMSTAGDSHLHLRCFVLLDYSKDAVCGTSLGVVAVPVLIAPRALCVRNGLERKVSQSDETR